MEKYILNQIEKFIEENHDMIEQGYLPSIKLGGLSTTTKWMNIDIDQLDDLVEIFKKNV